MPEAQVTARIEEESSAIATPQVVQTAHERFGDPKNFINRELSWLKFNRRVLEEAQDPTQPLIESETSEIGPDGLGPTETFDRIQKTVRQLVAEQYRLWKNELLPKLGTNGIYVREIAELPAKRAAWAHRYFQQEVL